MRAVVFHRALELACERVPDPRLEAPGDAIVRVEAAAVCGSDLHPYRGREAGLDTGTVMGHELAGEVIEVGPEVRGLAAGARVAAPFTTSCGACAPCREGLTCRCEVGQLLGWIQGGRGLHGAQAEYVRVPLADSTLVQLAVGVSAEAGLLAGDVLSTGYHCAASGGVRAGSRVAVVGCGPVGLMAVLAARDLGAAAIVAVDGVPERLALARRFGATTVDFTAADAREAVLHATCGRGADVVCEAVGSPQATRLAYALVRAGGTISAAGVHTEPQLAITPGEIYDKNLTYRGGRCPARAFMDRLLPRIARGELDPTPIISHRLPLEAGPRAYELFDKQLDGCTKVVLIP